MRIGMLADETLMLFTGATSAQIAHRRRNIMLLTARGATVDCIVRTLGMTHWTFRHDVLRMSEVTGVLGRFPLVLHYVVQGVLTWGELCEMYPVQTPGVDTVTPHAS